MPLSAGFELVDETEEVPLIDAHPVALPLGNMPVGACPVGHNDGVAASAVAVAALPEVLLDKEADDASTNCPDELVPISVLLAGTAAPFTSPVLVAVVAVAALPVVLLDKVADEASINCPDELVPTSVLLAGTAAPFTSPVLVAVVAVVALATGVEPIAATICAAVAGVMVVELAKAAIFPLDGAPVVDTLPPVRRFPFTSHGIGYQTGSISPLSAAGNERNACEAVTELTGIRLLL